METRLLLLGCACMVWTVAVQAQQKTALPDKTYTFTDNFEPAQGQDGAFFSTSFSVTVSYKNTYPSPTPEVTINAGSFRPSAATRYRYRGRIYTPAETKQPDAFRFISGDAVRGAFAKVTVVAWMGQTRIASKEVSMSSGASLPGYPTLPLAVEGMKKYQATVNTWEPDPNIVKEGAAIWSSLRFTVEKPVSTGRSPSIEQAIGSYMAGADKTADTDKQQQQQQQQQQHGTQTTTQQTAGRPSPGTSGSSASGSSDADREQQLQQTRQRLEAMQQQQQAIQANYNQAASSMAGVIGGTYATDHQKNTAIAQSAGQIAGTVAGQTGSMGAGIGAGVGVAVLGSMLGSSQESRARKEAEEAERRAEAEQRRLEAEIEAMRVAANRDIRRLMLSEFTETGIPLSSHKAANGVYYYFAYRIEPGMVESARPKIFVTNLFPVSRYSDGSWPFTHAVKKEILAAGGQGQVVLTGMYDSEELGRAWHEQFLGMAGASEVSVEQFFYQGKQSPAGGIAAGSPAAPSPVSSDDFWEMGSAPKPASSTADDDFWNQ